MALVVENQRIMCSWKWYYCKLGG